jgi:hypothetical protein
VKRRIMKMGSKQISNSFINTLRRWDIKLNGSTVIACNIIKSDSLVFLSGTGLLIEGLDNDYSIKDGEIELHVEEFKGKTLTIINQQNEHK